MLLPPIEHSSYHARGAGATPRGAEYDFTAHLTWFCRALRGHGLLIGPRETADAAQALAAVDVMDRGRVYWALRALLLSKRDDMPIYDALFERFWSFEAMPMRPDMPPDDGLVGGAKEFRRAPSVAAMPEEDAGAERTLVQMLREGASARRGLAARKDLSAIRADELAELARIAARMVRAMASRPGRRRKRHPRKGSPDLRAAFRVNMSAGGDIVRIPRRRRLPKTPRLLVMLDVSGSMDRHAQLLLQLAFAVAQQTRRVETFVFSTGAARITRELNAPSFGEALGRVGRVTADWSGGTQIGGSLAQINGRHGDLLTRHTTALLVSDGWDTGEPERIAAEARRLRRRVHRLVWLNPLLGSEGYEPTARSLAAALPYVDCHASARDVTALKRLPGLLR